MSKPVSVSASSTCAHCVRILGSLCSSSLFSTVRPETYFKRKKNFSPACYWKPTPILNEFTLFRTLLVSASIAPQSPPPPDTHKRTLWCSLVSGCLMKLIHMLTFTPDQHSQISSLSLSSSHTLSTQNTHTCVYLRSEHGGVNRPDERATSCLQSRDRTASAKRPFESTCSNTAIIHLFTDEQTDARMKVSHNNAPEWQRVKNNDVLVSLPSVLWNPASFHVFSSASQRCAHSSRQHDIRLAAAPESLGIIMWYYPICCVKDIIWGGVMLLGISSVKPGGLTYIKVFRLELLNSKRRPIMLFFPLSFSVLYRLLCR